MGNLLQDHIAAVTGSGSGIGRAIALGYAREGAQVVVLDINSEAAAETAKQIKDAGGKAQAFTLDVTRREDCFAMAKKVADRGRSDLDPGQQCRHQPPQSVQRRPTPSSRTGRTSWRSI